MSTQKLDYIETPSTVNLSKLIFNGVGEVSIKYLIWDGVAKGKEENHLATNYIKWMTEC